MKNINFKITEKNIQEYMKENISLVCHKEALFVDYMKKNQGITLEGLEILLQNYNERGIPLTTLDFRKNEVLAHLLTFEDYLQNSVLDMSAIYHILIPTLKLAGTNHINHSELIHGGYKIVDELEIPDIKVNGSLLHDVIDNYRVAEQLGDDPRYYRGYSSVLMTEEKCRKELEAYKDIYGKQNVQKIKKLVQEREW